MYMAQRISTRAPTRGATSAQTAGGTFMLFLLAPLHEGRLTPFYLPSDTGNFYSRPYARGDSAGVWPSVVSRIFLLAPLREGRPEMSIMLPPKAPFLLPPLREGRQQFFTKL